MAIFNHFASRKKYVKPCDLTKVIKELNVTGSSQTWVANKDCWLYFETYSGSGKEAYVRVNGNIIVGNNKNTVVPSLYAPKGTIFEFVVTASSTAANIKMVAYGCM